MIFPSHPHRSQPSAIAWRIGLALTLLLAMAMGPSGSTLEAQMAEHAGMANMANHTANYDLAARFAPYKFNSLLHTTMVNPRWIEGGDKFWYDWEDSNGKVYYLSL